ncbi:MAG: UDP-glucuronosyltransferase [Myxococcales bacterium]|nr:UDP-glucuronosyltransferase [Myxococcales bacterium]
MRILYGVTGEGMGHATRSKVILAHLLAGGQHAIEVVVSGRAHGFLTGAFPSLRVHEVEGLSMVYEDNRVQISKTAFALLKKLPRLADNHEVLSRIKERFRPQLVISDFESLSYYFSKAGGLPILSIDNMQILNRCTLEIDIPDEEKGSFQLAKGIVKAKLPHCDHYLITTFFYPPLRKERTSLYPPILRDGILDARATAERGPHVLCYQTSDTFTELLPTLRGLPGQFIVYGFKRDEVMGNVTLKAFSEDGFVRDLKSARAVMAGGGFSLMGEAVYLGKPMLAVPLQGQFEQTANALYLAKLGYGEYHRELSADGMARFLARADGYADNLRGYTQDRNRLILEALDRLIAEVQIRGRLV